MTLPKWLSSATRDWWQFMQLQRRQRFTEIVLHSEGCLIVASFISITFRMPMNADRFLLCFSNFLKGWRWCKFRPTPSAIKIVERGEKRNIMIEYHWMMILKYSKSLLLRFRRIKTYPKVISVSLSHHLRIFKASRTWSQSSFRTAFKPRTVVWVLGLACAVSRSPVLTMWKWCYSLTATENVVSFCWCSGWRLENWLTFWGGHRL